MQPNHYDLLGHVREGTPDSRTPIQMTRDSHQPAREHHRLSRNGSGAGPMRSEDSWIEVSSQPSSSSLSSAATNDDIVTTGLRVEREESGSHNHRSRRRRLQHLAAANATHISYPTREPSIASSSQDEYEESSSESDPVMSSSNEDLTTRSRDVFLLRAGSASPSEVAPSSDEEDDNSTALGMQVSPSPFVPQPNVFSHPPASQVSSGSRRPDLPLSSPTVVSSSSRRTATRNNSYSSVRTARTQQQHSPYNMISPSHQADHDAALRASLSTLLSYATAARGLPKNDTQPVTSSPSAAQPSAFRLVPESVAMGEESGGEESPPTGPSLANQTSAPNRLATHHKAPGSSPSNASPSTSKPKRRPSSSKDRSSAHPSTSKKSRRSNMTDSVSGVSPTLMTWVISAGVVVLFSAISFSAGYALGREVGRTEGSMMGEGGAGAFSGARASAGCGREAVKGGLKRLRWGAAAGSGISA